MSEQKQILEQYLKAKFSDKPRLSIVRLDKIADGWESDNYVVTVKHGDAPTLEDWVWRIYSGESSQVKAAREFSGMEKLFGAGYPVPRVLLIEAEHSPIDRPFVIMEYVQGDVMWKLLDNASADEQERLIDQFCKLFVRLHELDSKQFNTSPPNDNPFFFIDRWVDEARGTLQNFSELNISPFLDWVAARRDLFACARPAPVHQDFHPGNILVKADGSASVIDWTGFNVTDPRFDLSWTLVLAHAHGLPAWRDQIFKGYQRHAEKPVEHIEVFEAIACARRLFDLTISLTLGAQRLGMNDKAVESMRTYMEGHRRVYRLFIERTGLQIEAFDNLFR